MTPKNWMTRYNDVKNMALNAKRGEMKALCKTPGGREVFALCYGEKFSCAESANYSSACGAKNRAYFSPRNKEKPVIVLISGVHGQETEGIAALSNLISLLETGRDLSGKANEALYDAASRVRLVIVPFANPDGRERVQPDAIVGLTHNELRYWGQGTWADGSLCGWPECKSVHPMKGYGFLGGYYNDDGINIMHDNFFRPMAKETQAMIDLVQDEKADCALHLHGGSNSQNALLQPCYAPLEVNETICRLAEICDGKAKEYGLAFSKAPVPPRPHGDTPQSFNLVDALHHASGAVSVCFESNEGLKDGGEPVWNHEQILISHAILFEETINMFLEINQGANQ
ncbi:MAG: hypothetical protein IJC48_06645 [Clostridia bacterium]|nr:hypothetical protein [Clostridia bacterium]